jgi:hypothetical protein
LLAVSSIEVLLHVAPSLVPWYFTATVTEDVEGPWEQQAVEGAAALAVGDLEDPISSQMALEVLYSCLVYSMLQDGIMELQMALQPTMVLMLPPPAPFEFPGQPLVVGGVPPQQVSCVARLIW